MVGGATESFTVNTMPVIHQGHMVLHSRRGAERRESTDQAICFLSVFEDKFSCHVTLFIVLYRGKEITTMGTNNFSK